MFRCKIKVIKRSINQDLAKNYLDTSTDFGKNFGACDVFRDGQNFVVDEPWKAPEGFCEWAWADIRHDLFALANGADLNWIKQPGTAVCCCTDALRPVYFEIRRLEPLKK